METSSYWTISSMGKRELRQRLKQLGLELTAEWRAYASALIQQHLYTLLAELSPRRTAMYIPMRDEPDLIALMDELSKYSEIYVPRVIDEQTMAMYPYTGMQGLTSGTSLRIAQPEATAQCIAPSELDAVVVPAIAFDRAGYRLGRGAGYYDRYLAEVSAYTIGVTLGLMPIEELPRDAWDIPVDKVLDASLLEQKIFTT